MYRATLLGFTLLFLALIFGVWGVATFTRPGQEDTWGDVPLMMSVYVTIAGGLLVFGSELRAWGRSRTDRR